MQHISRMKGFQCTQCLKRNQYVDCIAQTDTHLIYKVLTVVIAELLSTYHAVQICLHKFLNEVDLFKGLHVGRAKDIEDSNDILMPKVAKKFNLAEGAQTEH